MQTILIQALQLFVALAILVTIHEFGHYIFARIFGIKVNRFYLFFNPWFSMLKYYPDKGKIELIAWTTAVKEKDSEGKEKVVREEPHALLTLNAGKKYNPVNKKGKPSWAATLYGIGWLPLGGYCDIAGMVDETKSASDLGEKAQPWEFRSKAAWQRFLVMVAGVVFNFILAIVIYAGIAFHWGERVVPFESVYEGMDFEQPMLDAGLQNGDILLTLNGERIQPNSTLDFFDIFQPGAQLKVLRNHKDTVTVTMPKSLLEDIAAVTKEKETAPMSYRIPVYADKVQTGMGADKGGMLDGDRIVKVGNDTTPSQTEFFAALDKNKGTTPRIIVERGGKNVPLDVEINEAGKIGIQLRPGTEIYPVEVVKYNILQSIPRGWTLGTEQLVAYVKSLKLLFTKEGVKQVGGFGTLGGLFKPHWDWYSFWQITAFLSVILAFMNIIPIPALDGGHVLFLLWEIITRRKPSDKFLEVANTIGFFFLLLLLILANGNDLLRLIP